MLTLNVVYLMLFMIDAVPEVLDLAFRGSAVPSP
jgi:hypothetical protein